MLLMGPLLRPYWRLRFQSFGVGSVCYKPYWLQGTNRIAVGDDVRLVGVWLVVAGKAWEDPHAPPRLRIGNGVIVLPYGRIVAIDSVVIEDDVGIAAGCLVTDGEHTMVGTYDSFAEGPLDSAPTRIGRGTLLGEHVTVLKGSNIGEACFIGANSVVRGEIPDFSVAVGAPARVVGRTRGAGGAVAV
jgi:acetyltransferase-like isoleucine patch superfamily enzyme